MSCFGMVGESVSRSWVDRSSVWRDGPGSVGGRGDGGGIDGSIVSVGVDWGWFIEEDGQGGLQDEWLLRAEIVRQ
jgi:hypothetical protein